MFCHNCGAQLPENAAFCPNCGQKITPISQPVSIQKPEAPPAEPVDAPVDSTDAPNETTQPDPQPGPQTDNTVPPSGTVTEAEVIGSNAAYYQAQFQKIRAGEKGNFNVAAFFLTLYHAAYRGPWKEWLKFMAIPLIGTIAAFACSLIGAASSLLGVIVAGTVLYVVTSIVTIIWAIRYGFAFNKIYLTYVEKQQYAPHPVCGTSSKRVVLSLLAVFVVSLVLSLLSVFVAAPSMESLWGLGDAYSQDTSNSETSESSTQPENTPDPEPEPEPAEPAPSTSDKDTSAASSQPTSGTVKVVRYANENGRIKDLPPADIVATDVKGLGYSGSIIIGPMDSGTGNISQGIFWYQLDVKIYDENWNYATDLYLYYTYQEQQDGTTTAYGLDITSISTNYDDEAAYYTKQDYLDMNEADRYYYGASPTAGVPWNDPTTGEWTLDGELYEGGLYSY